MKFKSKMVVLLFFLTLVFLGLIIFTTKIVGLEYCEDRMTKEFTEEARTLGTIWKYRAGGSTHYEGNVLYTALGTTVEEESKAWYDSWNDYVTTSADCSIIIPTEKGYQRIYTSLKDKNGKSLQKTYVDDPKLINKFDDPNSVDYNGKVKIGGKDYIVSYSFFYKSEEGKISYICALGEEISSIDSSLISTLHKYLLQIIALTVFIFVVSYFILNHLIERDLRSKIYDTIASLNSTNKSINTNTITLKKYLLKFSENNKALKTTLSNILNNLKAIQPSEIHLDIESIKAQGIIDSMTVSDNNLKKESIMLHNKVEELFNSFNETNSKFLKLEEILDGSNSYQLNANDLADLNNVLHEYSKQINNTLAITNNLASFTTKDENDLRFIKEFITSITNANEKYDINSKIDRIINTYEASLKKIELDYNIDDFDLNSIVDDVETVIKNLENI